LNDVLTFAFVLPAYGTHLLPIAHAKQIRIYGNRLSRSQGWRRHRGTLPRVPNWLNGSVSFSSSFDFGACDSVLPMFGLVSEREHALQPTIQLVCEHYGRNSPNPLCHRLLLSSDRLLELDDC
jgi:hypothetical protein